MIDDKIAAKMDWARIRVYIDQPTGYEMIMVFVFPDMIQLELGESGVHTIRRSKTFYGKFFFENGRSRSNLINKNERNPYFLYGNRCFMYWKHKFRPSYAMIKNPYDVLWAGEFKSYQEVRKHYDCNAETTKMLTFEEDLNVNLIYL